jgi:hypothetical protein
LLTFVKKAIINIKYIEKIVEIQNTEKLGKEPSGHSL